MIDTPTDEAHKEYIGNAACHGRMAAVFAQLIVGGESHGVHALVGPAPRRATATLLDGVRIEDCGEKMGLNGVDNGRIWFDQVRVPREALLNRYGDVSADGRVLEPDRERQTSASSRCSGTLVQGRVCISGASVSAAKSALTIAVRYGLRRRQFGPAAGRRGADARLPHPPAPADAAAGQDLRAALRPGRAGASGSTRVFSDPQEPSDRERRELESLAAGMKATASWHATQTIQTCRECCGGAGYMSVNRFAALKADTDIFTTFEGDNTVLMLLLATRPADRLPGRTSAS